MNKLYNPFAGRRQLLKAALGAAGAMAFTAPLTAFAQLANGRPIRMILPVGVGSGVDTITRAAGPAMSTAFGRSVVIENMPGAGGIIGTAALLREAADGHTVGMVSNNHVTFPSVYKSVPFDPINDITPISVVGSSPFVLVVNPELEANTVQELIALLKAKPGYYNFASSGNGTILHLAAEMFVQQADVDARHIPYKGVGPMITDIMSGQVHFGVLSVPSVAGQLASGGLRAVGACGAQRSKRLPDLPTLREQGLPDYDVSGWFATIAPAGLSEENVKAIYAGLKSAFTDAEVQKAMEAQGNDIWLMDPAATADYFRSEMNKYATIVKNANMDPV